MNADNDTDNLTDEQFAELVDAQCSPAAKRIAELQRDNARLRDDCLRMARALGIEEQYRHLLPNVKVSQTNREDRAAQPKM
jgi:hypothetical protein